ncbi:MAG: hypothetical protein ACX933_06925 [Marinobacter adhaerens]
MTSVSFNFLTLNGDLSKCIPSWVKRLGVDFGKLSAHKFESIPQLHKALQAGTLKSGQLVALKCRPSRFSPFLRNHFVSPIIGHSSNMRRGPQFDPRHVLGLLNQIQSQWTPAGILPYLGDDVYQAVLIDPDSPTFGTVSLLPPQFSGPTFVPHLNALIRGDDLQLIDGVCTVYGILRHADQSNLEQFGVDTEHYEVMRRNGDLYFLDCTGEYGECRKHTGTNQLGLWGAMYAQGHFEFTGGELSVDSVEQASFEAMKSTFGQDVRLTRSQGQMANTMIYCRGARFTLSHQHPTYSLHMDTDFANEFSENRPQFDQTMQNLLSNFEQAFSANGLVWMNARDVDFNYANSSEAITLLEQLPRQDREDPLINAIADWHRSRKLSERPPGD